MSRHSLTAVSLVYLVLPVHAPHTLLVATASTIVLARLPHKLYLFCYCLRHKQLRPSPHKPLPTPQHLRRSPHPPSLNPLACKTTTQPLSPQVLVDIFTVPDQYGLVYRDHLAPADILVIYHAYIVLSRHPHAHTTTRRMSTTSLSPA